MSTFFFDYRLRPVVLSGTACRRCRRHRLLQLREPSLSGTMVAQCLGYQPRELAHRRTAGHLCHCPVATTARRAAAVPTRSPSISTPRPISLLSRAIVPTTTCCRSSDVRATIIRARYGSIATTCVRICSSGCSPCHEKNASFVLRRFFVYAVVVLTPHPAYCPMKKIAPDVCSLMT